MNSLLSKIILTALCIVLFIPNRVEAARWNYSDHSSNRTCIMIESIMKLNVSYPTKDGTTSYGTYDLSAQNASVLDGNCGDYDQYILVGWTDNNSNNTIRLAFEMNNGYSLNKIVLRLSSAIFPNGNGDIVQFIYTGNQFWTVMSSSYYCKAVEVAPLRSEDGKHAMGSLEISQLQMEAFHKTEKETFSDAIDCKNVGTLKLIARIIDLATDILLYIMAVAVPLCIMFAVFLCYRYHKLGISGGFERLQHS